MTRNHSVVLIPLLALALVPLGCSDDGGYYSDESTFGDEFGDDLGDGGTSGNSTGASDDGSVETSDDQVAEESDTSTETDTGAPLCDDQSEVVLYLSPDDSNSMSSPVQVRAAVFDDPDKIKITPIRPWEFFNYYTFDYPPAPKGEVDVSAELFRLEEAPEGEYLLQIGVTSEVVTNEDRPPMNITLVLDESGSMTGLPMDLQKEACRAIASSLKAGDEVSMVGWDTQNAIKLSGYKVTGPNDAMLLSKIEALEPGGGTDLNGGLTAGYLLAKAAYDPTRINRVVLISDGGANAGETDAMIIADGAGANDMDGIYLVGVGVGYGVTYNDHLMDTVTDIGKGASVFLPDEAEAWKVFGTDFVNTMAVAARDVQVKLDMPPGFEIVKFSGEEYSEDPQEVEPQHLAPNDSMVFHQTIATCAPDLVTDETEITVTARYKDAI
ncbi:MAG: VWA domain-containing protein, partial [Myxococcales bacterium]|nr:VWA domain-containing protein [Myxococcales bacterium]